MRFRFRMRRRKRHRYRWRLRFLHLAYINLLNLFSRLKLKVEKSNEFEKKVREIYELLPKRDCGACGYGSCYECAVAIAKGEATLDTCKVLRASKSHQVSSSSKIPHIHG